MQAQIKTVIFYGVFALVFVLYAIVLGAPLVGLAQLGGATMALIASMTPLILHSLSLPGELTPAVLGGLMAYTAPGRASWVQTLVLLVLSGASWALYLHLQSYVSSEAAATALQLADVPANKVSDAVASLGSFSTSVRSFAAVIFAAILGIRFNDNVPVMLPADSSATTTADTSVAQTDQTQATPDTSATATATTGGQ